jgi:hypothetical protein
MCPRPRPLRGRVSFCDRVRTCRRWDCINVRQRERAKEARFAACTSLLTSPATRRMPPKCGAFPVQPRRSPLRQTACWSKPDSNLYGAFPVKWLFWFCYRFFVRSGKAVLRPVAYDQVRGARGRGQGTETVAKLGGLPPSVACVSQRPLFKPGAGFDA